MRLTSLLDPKDMRQKTGSHCRFRSARGASKRSAPRILFVGEAVCLAHVGRPALLARWAQDAGYEVAFACGPAFEHVAIGEGLQPIPIETITPASFHQRIDRGRFFYERSDLDAYVSAERKLIQRWQPDLIVGDFRLTLHVSAKRENIPMLSLINAHWSPAHPCRMPAPRGGPFRYAPPSLRDSIFPLLRPLIYRYSARAIDALRKRNGLNPLRELRRIYTAGDMCAYLDLPEIIPLPHIPRIHFYLGPLIWKPQESCKIDLERLDSERPLAYVSMGSSGDERVIPAILKGLESQGFNAVVSGVDSGWGAAWTRTHPNFKGRLMCSKTLNPDAVLKRSSVCICHGGSGTVYQSLSQGVPLICLPHNPDQGLVAQAIEKAGVGLTIRPEDAHATFVGNVLRRRFLESDHLHRAANSLARVTSIWNTQQRWTDWLKGYFNFDAVPSHTSSKSAALQNHV